MPVQLPWDNPQPRLLPLPSREEYLAGRRRKYGRANPEIIRDPFLEYMIKTRADPYFVREEFGDEHDFDKCSVSEHKDATAVWSFDRMGASTSVYSRSFSSGTYLIHIGGEHDDGGWPDFLIYNDVVVEDLQGNLWIYAYPYEVFPPTDFHTATIISEERDDVPSTLRDGILIIGGICYSEVRDFWRTPIYHLDLSNMAIFPVTAKGDEPGWIRDHDASLLSGGRLIVSGGKVMDEKGSFLPNTNVYELNLWTLTWTQSM